MAEINEIDIQIMKEKSTVSSPTCTALLCGSKISAPTVIYSDKDQALIDQARNNLQDYEKSLMHRIRKDGINWAITDQEMHSQFINDKTRIEFSDALIKCVSTLIPEKIIYTLTK